MPGKVTPKVKAFTALAMHQAGSHNGREIAEAVGVPYGTVYDILSGKGAWENLPSDPQYKAFFDEQYKRMGLALSEHFTLAMTRATATLPNASYSAAVLGAGLSFDKLRMLHSMSPNAEPAFDATKFAASHAALDDLLTTVVESLERDRNTIDVTPSTPGQNSTKTAKK